MNEAEILDGVGGKLTTREGRVVGLPHLTRGARPDIAMAIDEHRPHYRTRSERIGKYAEEADQKLRTTFIGALSIFEEAFGHLWGYRLPESELTDEQFECRKRWEFARTKILNNGNNQLRTALKEISEYSIEWNRHRASVSMEKCPQNQQNQQNYQ
jgi:hypothetical protein